MRLPSQSSSKAPHSTATATWAGGRSRSWEDAARWKRVLARAREVHAKGGGPSVGLGWHVRAGKVPCTWHNGRTGGSTSFLALDVEHQIAVVLLSNTSISVDELGFRLVEALRELASG
jgi:CubicO group peptidase (beta-lactamase class C family)